MRFRLRLMISIALLIAISFGIGGTVLITVSFQSALTEEVRAAQNTFETVRNTLYLLNSLGDQTDYDSLIRALTEMSGSGTAPWQALTLKSGDQLLYQNGFCHLLLPDLPVPQFDQWGYIHIVNENGPALQIISAIDTGDTPLVLEARFELDRAYSTRKTQRFLFMFIYEAVVVLGIGTAGALSFAMTRRLRRLTVAVRRIAGGNLSTRSNIRSQDEFGQLSRDFDTMADKLQENIHSLEEEMQRQEAFMGAFAHELKTPMTSIIGYADLLRQNSLDDTTRTIAANYIFSEGQRLEKLSFKLLELLLVQKDPPAMRNVSLPKFLQEIDRALSPVLRSKGIRLICRSDPGTAAMEPDLVKSLLYNLVDNAAKAMDGEGVIAVKAGPIPGGCQFQVADNGRGMEEAELSRITEAFYRVDKSRSRKQGGAGLGLALCREIVELHQGSLKFHSAPGTGTRVLVTIYGKAESKNA